MYIHQTAAYWELRLESVDGENAADVLLTLALKGSLGTLFPNVPVRALFDRVSAELAKMDMLTQEDVTEMLLGAILTTGMLKMLESVILEGDVEEAWTRAKALVQRQYLNGGVLNTAARLGHEATVRALIEVGADVNKARVGGEMPMHRAVTMSHDDVVRALIEAGAEISKATRKQIRKKCLSLCKRV